MNRYQPADHSENTARRRLRVIFILLGVALVFITGRLIQLTLVQGAELSELAENQQVTRIPLVGLRGTIYDRNGISLAIDHESPTAYLVPNEIRPEEREHVAEELVVILGLPLTKVHRLLKRDTNFAWLSRNVDDESAGRLREASLPGVYVKDEPSRLYPLGRTAAHVLGFIGVDHQGLEGLELAYEDLLSGKEGWTLWVRDAFGRPLYPVEGVQQPPERGRDLRLTIDARFQHIVDRELAHAVERSNARRGMAVMMDPRTGEVLALSNYPLYDPNRFGDYPAWVWRNRTVTDIYEPGSTFKVFTLAAALEEGVVTPDTVFDTPPETLVTGRWIKDSLPHDPRLTAAQIIEHSSNVGILQIGLKLGRDRLRKYLADFGFGEATGFEMPGEVRGILRPAEEWYPQDTACVSFGQGVAVTAIQLIRAYAVIVNGGLLVQPKIILGDNQDSTECVRVISQRTAAQLRQILVETVEHGLAKEAGGSGYTVGGKTGTAQKVGRNGYMDGNRYIASIIGFAPAEDPRLVLLIIIDEPRPVYGGGPVCGPAFSQIVKQVLALAGVSAPGGLTARLVRAKSPETPHLSVHADGEGVNLIGLNVREAASVLSARALNAELYGSGRVTAVSPGAGGTKVLIEASR